MAPEEREQRGTATEQEQNVDQGSSSQSSNGADANGSSALRTAAMAGALAAAAGTTVYVTRRILSSEQGAQESSAGAGAAKTAKGTVDETKAGAGGGRFDAFLATLNTQGLDAAANMLVPLAENAAHAAGAYAAERSPDFLADTVLPKFVDGFNEAREKTRDSKSGQAQSEHPASS